MITAWAGAVVLLIVLSALLTTAEASIFGLGAARLRTLVDEGFEGAPALARIRRGPSTLQAAIRLLTTILNFVAVGLAVALGSLIDGIAGALLALALIVAALLLVGGIVPRALATRRPIRIALVSAPALLAAGRLVGRLISPLLRLEAGLAGVTSSAEDEEEREVREMATLGRQEGVVNREEHALVERAFRLDELTAFDVMTPRVDVFAWKDDRPLSEIIDELSTVPYSRVPVYEGSVDNITGVLYVREAYRSWVAGGGDARLGSLAREPFFLPGSLSLAQVLREFQARHIHMAIVADEFGGTDGLVTLEDVLEELVGEIVDETDVEQPPLFQLESGELVAAGSVDLRDVNDAFAIALPSVENRSLNGFILEELGYVPAAGESLEQGGIRIEVLEASDTQVLRVRLSRTPGERRATDGEG